MTNMLSVCMGMALFFPGASDWLRGKELPSWLWVALASSVAFLIALLLRKPQRRTVPDVQSDLPVGDAAAGILPYRSSLPQLSSELARARRYQYPLTMLIIRLDQHQIVEKGNGVFSMKKTEAGFVNLLLSFVGSLLRTSLRDIDIVSYDTAGSQYVVLLPETTIAKAERPVSRLNDMSLKQTGLGLVVGMAEFPMDGLIIEDLVSSAEAACKNASEPAPARVVPVREKQRSHSASSVVQ